jgi:hypothetical protein
MLIRSPHTKAESLKYHPELFREFFLMARTRSTGTGLSFARMEKFGNRGFKEVCSPQEIAFPK